MPAFQAIVKCASAGSAVRLCQPGPQPFNFIAQGVIVMALSANASLVSIGTSAVGNPGSPNAVYQFSLGPGVITSLPANVAVDLSQLYLNANSVGDGLSLGWYN